MSKLFRITGLLKTEASVFLDGMAFMTRLCPARMIAAGALAATMRQMPLYGFVIGLLATLPLVAGLTEGHPFVQSWIYVGLCVWLTRALHWDGWADLWDAWGSCAQGERFWQIMKDSHIGAFGVIGLVMGMGGQIVCAAAVLSSMPVHQAVAVLVWAPALGRTACVLLSFFGTKASCSSLGKQFLEGATPAALAVSMTICIGTGIWLAGVRILILSFVVLIPAIIALVRLARRQNGLNGDFMGAIIIWGEIAALLGAILA
ncbi:adenosylcobinamide-GDP ribazoletransferase [Oleidesulfovibrio sp.]|uniref:adenosylcobinamide-GDP ribazoletransferase n=1 Tax=Oleidesulfovibrio sp. TaxID=2909707 RepID=UPI003A83705F